MTGLAQPIPGYEKVLVERIPPSAKRQEGRGKRAYIYRGRPHTSSYPHDLILIHLQSVKMGNSIDSPPAQGKFTLVAT